MRMESFGEVETLDRSIVTVDTGRHSVKIPDKFLDIINMHLGNYSGYNPYSDYAVSKVG